MICDGINLSFNHFSPKLKSLPIMGFGYHLSLDFIGPFVVTLHGAKYILVMVGHLSKCFEIVALLQNCSKLATMAFFD